jgi:hypothetical protein
MAHELKGREIFAVGTWNGVEFTDEDLDDIVSNFERLKEEHHVPLKFGHNDEQPITDGQPAIGWVERIFKQGSKLYADFTHMPRTVFELIKNKLYRTVSIELLFNVDKDGKKFNHILDAVALLGADQPAVSSLADLDALLATRTRFTGGHKLAFETIAGTSKKFKVKPGDDEMDDKKVQELIDATLEPLKATNAKLTADLEAANKKLAEFTAKQVADEKAAKLEKIKASRKAVTEILDQAVRDKKLTPAFRENYEKQIGLEDDERVESIDLEQVKSMFSVKVVPGQQGLIDDEDKDDVDSEAELVKLTRKNMAETGSKDFRECFMRVAAANPELHKDYLDSNGVN